MRRIPFSGVKKKETRTMTSAKWIKAYKYTITISRLITFFIYSTNLKFNFLKIMFEIGGAWFRRKFQINERIEWKFEIKKHSGIMVRKIVLCIEIQWNYQVFFCSEKQNAVFIMKIEKITKNIFNIFIFSFPSENKWRNIQILYILSLIYFFLLHIKNSRSKSLKYLPWFVKVWWIYF